MKDYAPIPFHQILPWQQKLIEHIHQKTLNGNQATSILIHSLFGLGLWNLSESLAYTCLCESENKKKPCQTCNSCQIIQQNIKKPHPQQIDEIQYLNHPAIWQIQNTQHTIKIDLIREITEKIQTKLHNKHIIIIGLIENLNEHAYNALLKTIEEPNPGQQFILLTHRFDHIPQTIKSRCQKFYLSPNFHSSTLEYLINEKKMDEKQAKQHLLQTQGRPLLYLQQKQIMEKWHAYLNHTFNQKCSIFEHQKKWLEQNPTELINYWLEMIYQFVQKNHHNPKRKPLIQKLDQFIADLYQAKQKISASNLPVKLILNTLLLQWSELKYSNHYQAIF